MKKISGKRAKTDADYEQLSKLEFFGSLYMNSRGPCIPAMNLEACLIDGAKKTRNGPAAKSGIICGDCDLIYDGPRDADGLWEQRELFLLKVPVGIKNNRVMRSRPIFPDWSAIVEVQYQDSILNKDEVIGFATKAGELSGILDWRPRYGRFFVDVVSEAHEQVEGERVIQSA